MKELLADKKYKPVIDRSYPMEQIQDAFKYLLTGEKIGNVVLNIAE